MKISNFLIIALFSAFVLTSACNNKKDGTATDQTTVATDGTITADHDAISAAQSTSGDAHYKCPKNCEGGVGSGQGKCPVCGTDMVHNPAFHAQTPTTPGTSPQTPIQVDPTNATGTANANPTPSVGSPEPAQNAKGVWHFTCSKGCEGGAGAVGKCAKCGNALTHNQAYH